MKQKAFAFVSGTWNTDVCSSHHLNAKNFKGGFELEAGAAKTLGGPGWS
jgi:hypothetical protein